jgi:hypothetical protein
MGPSFVTKRDPPFSAVEEADGQNQHHDSSIAVTQTGQDSTSALKK